MFNIANSFTIPVTKTTKTVRGVTTDFYVCDTTEGMGARWSKNIKQKNKFLANEHPSYLTPNDFLESFILFNNPNGYKYVNGHTVNTGNEMHTVIGSVQLVEAFAPNLYRPDLTSKRCVVLGRINPQETEITMDILIPVVYDKEVYMFQYGTPDYIFEGNMEYAPRHWSAPIELDGKPLMMFDKDAARDTVAELNRLSKETLRSVSPNWDKYNSTVPVEYALYPFPIGNAVFPDHDEYDKDTVVDVITQMHSMMWETGGE